MMTVTYGGRNSIYVNMTNRCPCACVFCLRHNKDHVFNSDSLWLEREPTVKEICDSIDSWDLEKYDEIVAFSELGDFIESPVRNYSSGMVMRLAFSIASMVNPDILIVDEILSVGDAAFQEKSHARMLEMMGHGTTVLLVSHNIEQVRSLCDRVIWLDHGRIVEQGDTQTVCDHYSQANHVL